MRMNNVIELKDWAKSKQKHSASSEIEKEVAFWARSYKSMQFNSLILEANDLITELRTKDLSKQDWARARAILREIEIRLASDGRPEAEEIRSMTQDLEARLQKLSFL